METFISNHESIEDYKKTLKQAYLYGKAVTLMSTHWPETNEVMQRNRRIGTSMTGVVQFVEERGYVELKRWLDLAYDYVQYRDRQYSEWLGVRESIKTTSIKPSGTVSLLAGVTPGVHWPPAAGWYIRRVRYAVNDAIVPFLIEAGYHHEPDVQEPETTLVFEFPTKGPDVREDREVSLWEKAELAVVAAKHWADNQVSVTLSFTPDEESQVGPLLQAKEGQLKSVSFLPLGDSGGKYAQMPYEKVGADAISEMQNRLLDLNWKKLYAGAADDAEGERFCNNDVCLV